MSLSFNCKMSLSFSAFFSNEEVGEMHAMILKVRSDLADDADMHPGKRALGLAMVKAYEEGEVEGLAKFFLRDTAKQLREVILSEVGGNNLRKFAPAHIEITGKAPAVEACGLHDESKACTALCKRFTEVR